MTRVAVLDGSRLAAVEYDDAHPYERTASYDHGGRPTAMTLPIDPDYVGAAPRIGGSLTYNARGLPASVGLGIDTVSRDIVSALEYTRDGLVERVTYGDDLVGSSARTPTTSVTTYDDRRRPIRMTTTRTPTGMGAPGEVAPLAAVTTPHDQRHARAEALEFELDFSLNWAEPVAELLPRGHQRVHFVASLPDRLLRIEATAEGTLVVRPSGAVVWSVEAELRLAVHWYGERAGLGLLFVAARVGTVTDRDLALSSVYEGHVRPDAVSFVVGLEGVPFAGVLARP